VCEQPEKYIQDRDVKTADKDRHRDKKTADRSSEADLETARNSGERGESFFTRWADKLRDLRFTVDVVRSGLGLYAHVVDGSGARVQHLTVAKFETEVTVDVDG